MLTINEVATKLKIHADTVRREIRAGRLKASRLRRAIRIDPDDVETYIRQQRIKRPDEKTFKAAPPKPAAPSAHDAAMLRLQKLGALK